MFPHPIRSESSPLGVFSGKTLGGSTSINGAAYTRGLNAQYDAWSSLLETSEASVGWNWQNLWTYMKKARHSHFLCTCGLPITSSLVRDVLCTERTAGS